MLGGGAGGGSPGGGADGGASGACTFRVVAWLTEGAVMMATPVPADDKAGSAAFALSGVVSCDETAVIACATSSATGDEG